MVYTFDSSTQGQPDLYSEFKDSQGYIETLSQKLTKVFSLKDRNKGATALCQCTHPLIKESS